MGTDDAEGAETGAAWEVGGAAREAEAAVRGVGAACEATYGLPGVLEEAAWEGEPGEVAEEVGSVEDVAGAESPVGDRGASEEAAGETCETGEARCEAG